MKKKLFILIASLILTLSIGCARAPQEQNTHINTNSNLKLIEVVEYNGNKIYKYEDIEESNIIYIVENISSGSISITSVN